MDKKSGCQAEIQKTGAWAIAQTPLKKLTDLEIL
jgi:hypothetical protein